MRTFGTQAIGIRTPIIHQGDNLPEIITNSIIEHTKETNTVICDHDIIGITEAVVARAQGNYATVAQIAADIKAKFPTGPVGIVFPILSRNRFSILLKAIAAAVDELYIQLSYPTDEVGNHIISTEQIYEANINPHKDVFSEQEFRQLFPDLKHKFTAIDYLELYRNLGNQAKIILANDPCEILKYTKNVLIADIHTRTQTKRRLIAAGAQTVYGLEDILTKSIDHSGYNQTYGLLGSNKASEDKVKLFPHSCETFVADVQKRIYEKTGAKVEVLVYGDGAFKDPVGKIWELADPIVSPAFTDGLLGLPNELKLKYIADTEFAHKRGDEAREAIIERIRQKQKNLIGKEETEGTTPRRLTDLIGSLCDLISGSGDKGTPLILIKGYFDNYACE
ncbi:MAG: coenzyme F420-0:L-glutamate ligase [Nitrososphaerota archaeon]|jgi:F420-0:gamma-glutamyl ligase|nr:coenzyme F420-0:L-glutamate ligase [Nitrososphaerota archaeon]